MTTSAAIEQWVQATQPKPKARSVPRENVGLRRLFWLYFWLLIFEGVLRKWVVPSLSIPLLMIRDPIPLAILWIGIRQRVFPRTVGIYMWLFLALALATAGFFVLPDHPEVVLYGLKCDFLHLTMLAIAPILLESADLDRFFRAVIWLSVPIGLLMAWQFHAPPHAWINSGLDGTFKQLDSSGGHIRPPGPFSFIAGPMCFCALLAALLTGAAVDRRRISRPLLLVGAGALIVAGLYSSSRSLVGGVAVVVLTGLLGAMAVNPRVFGRYLGILVALGFVGVIISTSSMMEDSVQVFSNRVSNASRNEGGGEGFVNRYFGDFAKVVPAVQTAPFAGYGLGLGTNGGASILTGKTKFLLAETEWPRVVLESGPVLGLLFIAFRIYLVIWLGWRSLQAVRRGTVLAACLLGACGANLVTGQFGQATIVGFTMFTAGLCLTAAERGDEPAAEAGAEGPGLRGSTPGNPVLV